MRRTSGRIKLICVVAFGVIGIVLLAADVGRVVRPVAAFSEGPPPGHTGAPGEQTCTNCHFGVTTGGTFTITAPATYTPGQTYQIIVTHQNADPSRKRWGFQLTPLTVNGANVAGTLSNITPALTQIVGGVGRDYIEHTGQGTFNNQLGGAQWGFNWTAPPIDLGTVRFYAAGNQANGNGNSDGDRIITATADSQPSAPEPPAGAAFDFDADGKSDVGIFRPGPGEWWIRRSGGGVVFAAQFGASTDIIAPGDFTGDNKDDFTIWRPSTGEWFVLRSEDFSFFSFPFGTNGDVPVPANFDGDAKTDAAIFRPSNSTWFIARSTGGIHIEQFGAAGDQPVPADYDGDDRADIAIRRPVGGSGSEWWLKQSTAGVLAVTFGGPTDRTVHADYTGDGKTDVAIWRPSTGVWFILRSEDFSFYSLPFGTMGDVPAPGDYDGDGKSDTAVFRPSDTNWYIDRSTAGTQIIQFGAAGDIPIESAYVR